RPAAGTGSPASGPPTARAPNSTGRRPRGTRSASTTARGRPPAAKWGCRRCAPAASPARNRRSAGRTGRTGADRAASRTPPRGATPTPGWRTAGTARWSPRGPPLPGTSPAAARRRPPGPAPRPSRTRSARLRPSTAAGCRPGSAPGCRRPARAARSWPSSPAAAPRSAAAPPSAPAAADLAVDPETAALHHGAGLGLDRGVRRPVHGAAAHRAPHRLGRRPWGGVGVTGLRHRRAAEELRQEHDAVVVVDVAALGVDVVLVAVPLVLGDDLPVLLLGADLGDRVGLVAVLHRRVHRRDQGHHADGAPAADHHPAPDPGLALGRFPPLPLLLLAPLLGGDPGSPLRQRRIPRHGGLRVLEVDPS